MAHTRGRLAIGYDGSGYIHHADLPDPFARELGERVEVTVETPCYVKFDPNAYFDSIGYTRPGFYNWAPHTSGNDTVKFDVLKSRKARRYHTEGTHSIKIGSGRASDNKKAKTEAQDKTKKAKRKSRLRGHR